MNRRTAIYNFLLLYAGATILPSCGGHDTEATIPLKNLSLTASEGKMMVQLADIIIPKTNFIGAADVEAAGFTLMMVDDCYTPEKQKIFQQGLREFEKGAKKKYGKSFISCTNMEKKEWLTAMENKKDVSADAVQFYEAAKRHTVQAFTSSKEYLTNVVNYKMVPGSNFKGCVPVNKV